MPAPGPTGAPGVDRRVDDVDAVVAGLGVHDYLADEGLATAVFLALRLQRPLFLEGDAGVGKTEVAKALAAWTGGPARAPAVLRGHRRGPGPVRVGPRPPAAPPPGGRGGGPGRGAPGSSALEGELYDERFLVRRPLLQALYTPEGARAAGAAHRRDRPGRRRVRGVPARAAVRLGRHHPRAGHGAGRRSRR